MPVLLGRRGGGGSKKGIARTMCVFIIVCPKPPGAIIHYISYQSTDRPTHPPLPINHTHKTQNKNSFGFVKRVLASLLPTLGGGAKSFTEAFEAEYGKRHPTFIEAPTLTQALTAARVACKFLVVYLPSASPRDEKRHRAFCRTLTDPEVCV